MLRQTLDRPKMMNDPISFTMVLEGTIRIDQLETIQLTVVLVFIVSPV